MKKSRTLVIVLMVLAIVTSLCAGTLAMYTSNLEGQTGDVSVAAKPFVLTAATTESQALNIKLAPNDVRSAGGGEEVEFVVRNYTDASVAEVPIKVSFNLISTGELFKVDGLDIKIIDCSKPKYMDFTKNDSWIQGYMAKKNVGLELKYTPTEDIVLPAGVKTDRVFRVRCQWLNNNGHDAEHTAAALNGLSGTLTLSVSGVQVAQ